MKDLLEQKVIQACQDLFNLETEVELTRTEEQFGDYSTNVALKLAGRVGKNPREIAETLATRLKEDLKEQVSEVSVAGPGFINLKLADQSLVDLINKIPVQSLKDKVVVAEYSDPNPFKMLHAGHVYTTIVGDAVANLMETAGGDVHRVNYGGDVGLHVGKTMWSILKKLGGEYPEKLSEIPEGERSRWLSSAYVEGNNVYETREAAKAEIIEYNKRVYKLHAENDHESPFAQIYWTCRQWSYEAFDAFYARLGTKQEKYYPESEVVGAGLIAVKEQVGKVFSESDGAVIFKGEPYGLHTRVFINSEGLPTYEAKEIGLFIKKQDDYAPDLSVILTDNEQEHYMDVVIKALEQFMPDLARKTKHVLHGKVKLSGGVKMSSRLGNIVPAGEVLDETARALSESSREPNEDAVLGAVKYGLLKTRLGSDLIYDAKESISLEGNSGPYLQYAHARARSIIRKAEGRTGSLEGIEKLEAGERTLARKLSEYSEVIDNAINELMPHYICTYLYELSQTFNRFYENNRVIADDRENIRLALVTNYADKLKSGLGILGIAAPDKM